MIKKFLVLLCVLGVLALFGGMLGAAKERNLAYFFAGWVACIALCIAAWRIERWCERIFLKTFGKMPGDCTQEIVTAEFQRREAELSRLVDEFKALAPTEQPGRLEEFLSREQELGDGTPVLVAECFDFNASAPNARP